MDDKIQIISLKCSECENTDCKISRKWIHSDSTEGCTRKVSNEVADMYSHYAFEVLPFLYMDTTQEYQSKTYSEYINILSMIYTSPLGQKIADGRKLK